MPNIELLNIDCIEYMKTVPDKHFELSIVDPPYGKNANKRGMTNYNIGAVGDNGWRKKPTRWKVGDWDSETPSDGYFMELDRVSKKLVIWGGNHFNLPPSNGYLVWDKCIGDDFSLSQCELAWTNCVNTVRKFTYNWSGFVQGPNGNIREQRIHPTQKPVALYKWLLTNYAKKGDKILDTHGGSMSIAIACHDYGFDLTLCELDKDYYDAGVKRYNNHIMQQKLF